MLSANSFDLTKKKMEVLTGMYLIIAIWSLLKSRISDLLDDSFTLCIKRKLS